MIWTIAESINAAETAVGAAQKISKDITMIYFGSAEDAQKVAQMGPQKVYHVVSEVGLEEYGPALATFLGDKDVHILILAASIRGRNLAGYLASKMGTAVCSGVTAIENSDGIVCTRMAFGGAADRKEKITGKMVITANFGAFPLEDATAGTVEELSLQAGRPGVVIKEFVKSQETSINLNAAKRVVAVGRGFSCKEDLQMAQDLANIIDAALGCSRPVAEGLDWMSKDTYIGSTGAILNADVYIACGISGQIQHMSGALSCKTIFAINKDSDALIFKHADYGLIGTVEEVLPKLVAALKG